MSEALQGKPSDTMGPVWIRGNWVTGSLFEFLRTPLSFYERAAAHGDVVFGRLAHIPVCVLTHPRFVERVLTRETEVFEQSFIIRKSLQVLLGEGLLIAGRASSARQRPLVIQALHAGFAELWAKVVVEEAGRLAASWRKGETRDFYQTMLRMVAAILQRVAFGESAAAEKLGEIVDTGMRRAEDFPPVPAFIPTPRNLSQRRAIHRMDQALAASIRAERANPSAQATLLSALVKVRGEGGGQLSDRDVRDQITMIHTAVYQNMAAVLTWTFVLLSENDQSYEEIRSEVAALLENRVPKIGDPPRLTCCANAVKEALRLYPPVWQVFRQANRDTELDGYKIRQGTQVMFSEWVLQRDARFFPEPEKFRPRRWENPKPEWEFAFFPFGAGPRACLGRELCLLASVLILGVFTQRFRLQRVGSEKIEVDPAFALRPRKPAMMKAEGWAST